MLFDQVAASMPNKGVLAHSQARMREIRAKVYGKPKRLQQPVKIETVNPVRNKIRFAYNPWLSWQDSLRISLETLHAKLGDGKFKKPVGPIVKSMEEILQEVSSKHGIPVDMIKKTDGHASRKVPVILARQEFFYRCCKETLNSLTGIARFAGGFDHTSVLHGRDKYVKRLKGGQV